MQNSSGSVINVIRRVLDEGGVAALATIVAGTPVGAKLLIERDGTSTGSLGNGQLDQLVAAFAQKFIDSREEAKTFHVGEIAQSATTQGDIRILFERIQPSPRLVICGAGHVGAALAKLASFLNFNTTIIDDRGEFLTRERFADNRVELKLANGWAAAVKEAIGNGHGVAVAIVTRGHNEDEECLRAVMTTDPDYVGLIGSKRRTNIVLERLREAGTPTERLSRVHAPVGLDIGAVTPEEVALAILAEIVAQRRGGRGGSLSAWRRQTL
jgi:xanthine dehydrogenase accessory factor